MSLVIGFCIGLSFGVMMSKPCPSNEQSLIVENNNYIVDTVEVIEEDSIRWYTLDTMWYTLDTMWQVDVIEYESIDTTVINWPWGREEFYYFKYKES